MDTFCVENGHICFLIPNASRGQRCFQTYISSLLLFFLLLSSDLLSVLQQVSFSKCAKQQIQILWWMLPAWLLNDPPAAMKHSATSKCIAWRFIWHDLVRQKFFVGSSWRRLRRVKHANWPGRRRFAESLGSFVGTRGGLTSWCRVEHAQWPGRWRFAESLGFLVDRYTSGWKISIGWSQAVMKCEQSKKVYKFGLTFLCWVLLIPTLSLSLSDWFDFWDRYFCVFLFA